MAINYKLIVVKRKRRCFWCQKPIEKGKGCVEETEFVPGIDEFPRKKNYCTECIKMIVGPELRVLAKQIIEKMNGVAKDIREHTVNEHLW